MEKEIYIKERAYGISTTVTNRKISSYRSTYFKYNNINDLATKISKLSSESSILQMLSIYPNLKYEININTFSIK